MAEASASHPSACGNCGAALTGPYCAACGQHAHGSVRSLAVLLHEAWHVSTHLDGRFWKSMYFLLVKPGRLTREYFEDHRARFLPPVRLYLVLSIIFFASLVSVPHAREQPHAGAAAALNKEAASAANPADGAAAPPAASSAPSAKRARAADDEDDDVDGSDSTESALSEFLTDVSACKDDATPSSWFKRRLHASCERYGGSISQPVTEAFFHNLPRMMVVMAPLLALIMLLLYWFPRRYYVEHVVYFLHNHAAVFLISIVAALLWWLTALLHWTAVHRWIVGLALLYMAWYVYKSMRVFYAQGRILTVCKMSLMYLIYFAALLTSIILTVAISVVTV